MSIFKKFISNELGATAIEYGLIAALIAVVIITALTTLGTTLNSTFQASRRHCGKTRSGIPGLRLSFRRSGYQVKASMTSWLPDQTMVSAT